MEKPRINIKFDKGDKMSDSDSSHSDLAKDDEDLVAKFGSSKSKSDKEMDKDKDDKSISEKICEKISGFIRIYKPYNVSFS